MIFTESQPKYSVLDLGFDKALTKSLLGLQGETTPEMMNVFSGGTVPRTLIAGELIVALEQQTGVIFSGKTSFSDTTAGYRMGIDSDNEFKFIMGTTGQQIDWNVTTANTLTVDGSLAVDSLDIGGSDATSWHVDTDGNMWWGSASSYAAATIKVSSVGSIDFTTGTFSGTLSAAAGTLGAITAGTLTGLTITGGTIQTATSGKRIVMSENVMEFYSIAGTNIASLGAGALGTTVFLAINSPSAVPFDGLFISQHGAGKSGITIVCDDSGAGSEGIFLQNDGDSNAMRILSNSTSAGMALEFNYLGTNARMIYAFNNSASNVVAGYFTNNNSNNASNTVEIYKITSNSAGYALFCSITGTETGVAGSFKQATAKSTNFFRVLLLTGGTTDIYVWVSDGTDPNGTLSGTQGAVCFNCSAGGLIKYCAGGTTWTSV